MPGRLADNMVATGLRHLMRVAALLTCARVLGVLGAAIASASGPSVAGPHGLSVGSLASRGPTVGILEPYKSRVAGPSLKLRFVIGWTNPADIDRTSLTVIATRTTDSPWTTI